MDRVRSTACSRGAGVASISRRGGAAAFSRGGGAIVSNPDRPCQGPAPFDLLGEGGRTSRDVGRCLCDVDRLISREVRRHRLVVRVNVHVLGVVFSNEVEDCLAAPVLLDKASAIVGKRNWLTERNNPCRRHLWSYTKDYNQGYNHISQLITMVIEVKCALTFS